MVDAFVAICRHHHVLGLQETAHDIKNGGLAHLRLVFFVGKRRVGTGQKVQTRRGNQRGDQTHQIVVHIARITEWGGARGHDCRDKLIDLSECGRVNAQTFCGNSIQRCIVQHNDTVSILNQTFKRKYRVIRLNDNVRSLFSVNNWKHRICLRQFFWISEQKYKQIIYGILFNDI